MSHVAIESVTTPVGTIRIHCSDAGVKELQIAWSSRRLEIGENREKRDFRTLKTAPKKAPKEANDLRTPAAKIAARAKREVQEYFAGRRRSFTVPLAAEGTEFQKKVWSALCEIPYGEVCSYGEIARRVGNPKASRAVGTANGANPLAIIVPCHRVIAGNGGLGGFGGGLTNKTYLLTLEQQHSGK